MKFIYKELDFQLISLVFSELIVIQIALNEIFRKSSKDEKLMKKILDLMNMLKILETQQKMVKEIIEGQAELLEEIKKKYGSLGEYSIQIKCRDELNFFIIQNSINFITKNFLVEFKQIINKMTKNPSPKNFLTYLNDLKIIVNLFNFFLKKQAFFEKKLNIFSLKKISF